MAALDHEERQDQLDLQALLVHGVKLARQANKDHQVLEENQELLEHPDKEGK